MKRDDLPSLLLLPFPPDPCSRQALNAAYRPSLAAVFRRLKSPDTPSKLVIGIAAPILRGHFARHKSLVWAEAQSLVAGIYTLIAVVSAELSIGTDVNGGPGSVDATVVLIDHDRNRKFGPDHRIAIEPNNTAIVDLTTFASAYFPWNYIFHVNTEAGIRFHQTYLTLAEGKQTLLQEQLVSVDAGLYMNILQSEPPETSPEPSAYPVVCLGGTFDHLHPGHKLLLTAAAFLLKVPEKDSGQSCLFVIGVTGDELLKRKKFAELVQPWDERARNILIFLSTILALSPSGWKDGLALETTENEGDFRASFRNGTITIQCVKIQDPYGPTITSENMDALVVSGETRAGGAAVNDKRRELGWREMKVFEVDVLDAEEIGDETTRTENFAAKISSTAIRQQKAERSGA